MITNTKVAGTTFHPLPNDQYVRVTQTYTFESIPCADVDAVLLPEPTNQYDPDAVKVMIPLESGEAFHIGYLPKESELKQIFKANPVPRAAVVMIKNFALNSSRYNPSWIITEVKGL